MLRVVLRPVLASLLLVALAVVLASLPAAAGRTRATPAPFTVQFVSPLAGATLDGEMLVFVAASGGNSRVSGVTVSGAGPLVDLDPRRQYFAAQLDASLLAPGAVVLTATAVGATGASKTATLTTYVPVEVEAGVPADPALPAVFSSEDGAAEIVVPAFAMPVLATPVVEPLPRAEAPLPALDEILLGAVRAEPDGLQFDEPVTLRFPVEGMTLPAGSHHPLSLYDPETRSWGETGSEAVVSDDGTTFEAQVTHFSLYAVRGLVSSTPLQPAGPTFTGRGNTSLSAGPGEAVTVRVPEVSSEVGVVYAVSQVVVTNALGEVQSLSLNLQSNGDTLSFAIPGQISAPLTAEITFEVGNSRGLDTTAITIDICSISSPGPRPIFLVPGYNMPAEKYRGDSFFLYPQREPSTAAENHLLYERLAATGRPVYLLDMPNHDPSDRVNGRELVDGTDPVRIAAEGTAFSLPEDRRATRGDIVTNAVSLMHQIEAVLDELDGADPQGDYFSCAPRQVDVVGYSTGGLIGRYAATYLQPHASFRIRNLVTVATPHRGVTSAAFALANGPVGTFLDTVGDVAPQELWRLNPVGVTDDSPLTSGLIGCDAPAPSEIEDDPVLLAAHHEWTAMACFAVSFDLGEALRALDPFALIPDIVIPSLAERVDAWLAAGLDTPTVIGLLEAAPIPALTRVTTVAGRRFTPDDHDAGTSLGWPSDLVTSLGPGPVDRILPPYDREVLSDTPTELFWDGSVSTKSAHLPAGAALHYARKQTVGGFTFHAQAYGAIVPDHYELVDEICVAAGSHHICELPQQQLSCALEFLMPGFQDLDALVDFLTDGLEDSCEVVAEGVLDLANFTFIQPANALAAVANAGVPNPFGGWFVPPADPPLPEWNLLPVQLPYMPDIRTFNKEYAPVWSSCDPNTPMMQVFTAFGRDDNGCDWVLNNDEVNDVVESAVREVSSGWFREESEPEPANPVAASSWLGLLDTCLLPHPRDPLGDPTDPDPEWAVGDPIGNHERIQAFLESRRPCVAGSLAPTAVAGSDVVVTDSDDDGFETVVLDGSASYDPEGDLVRHSWVAVSGLGILGDGEQLAVDFPVGLHTVELEVTDGAGATDADLVEIEVLPPPPGSCGNGVVDAPGEQCDGLDFDGKTCADFIPSPIPGRSLTCQLDCIVNSSSCCPNETLTAGAPPFTGTHYDAAGSALGTASFMFSLSRCTLIAIGLQLGVGGNVTDVMPSRGDVTGDLSLHIYNHGSRPFDASLVHGWGTPPAGCFVGSYVRGPWSGPVQPSLPLQGSFIVCRGGSTPPPPPILLP